jgi:signal transduction histidine kinase
LRQQLQVLAGDRFRVESRVTGKSALILADGASLQLALLNICRNALEAMPQGGVVVLGIRSPAGTGPSFAGVETGLPAGEFVHFYVKDSGRGIASGDLERIFHPFYSTKPSGQGTGMGLSVAHGIIRDHGGLIRVNSRKGSGTTIHLFLPLLSGDPHAAAV